MTDRFPPVAREVAEAVSSLSASRFRLKGRPSPTPEPATQAPAWFHSALAFLGRRYVGADDAVHTFAPVLAGSDVDPYARLGANKLFAIELADSEYRLAVAPTPSGVAVLSPDATSFDATDVGIAAMYQALAADPAFAAVRFVYVPGALSAQREASMAARLPLAMRSGYDPSTGLRVVNYGSALAQAVPVSTFVSGGNLQSYDATPHLVPVSLSLVYDVADHLLPGDMTYELPAVYTVDKVADGATYASYHDGVTTPSPRLIGAPERIGALTYTGSTPAAHFALQSIAGFHRDPSWTTSLGTPVYDFGEASGFFTAAAAKPTDPVLVFDPASSPLNGGALPAVLATLQRATTLSSNERLLSYVEQDATIADGPRAGLVVTTAELDFDATSGTAGPLADRLAVPVNATVTLTPNKQPKPRAAAATGRLTEIATDGLGSPALDGALRSVLAEVPIGAAGNVRPTPAPAGPVTATLAVEAFVPREALVGTGITLVPGETSFLPQTVGSADAIRGAGTVWLNLTAAAGRTPAPWQLEPAALGADLVPGTTYVVAVAGSAATVRALGGATQTVSLATSAPASGARYVGAFTAADTDAAVTPSTLYPLASLSFTAPSAIGVVTPGATYQVRLSYAAAGGSTYDLLDSTGAAVATGLVASDAKTDQGRARSGDLYLGSFVGGTAEITVWSVPVLARLEASQLPAGSGAVTVSGSTDDQATWSLKVTDSTLFVHSSVDPDTGAVSANGADNAYLASAVVNSAPDDLTSAAFGPNPLLLGAVREVSAAAGTKFAFVPQDDNILIDGTRYLVSVVDIEKPTVDPTSRPYPPAYWPSAQYWEFANRHNPYLDVRYEGETQDDRIARASADVDAIRTRLAETEEPLHLYLDTDREQVALWPIYAFPFVHHSQGIDISRLSALVASITSLIEQTQAAESLLHNPYIGTAAAIDGNVATTPPATTVAATVVSGAVSGTPVTNLTPNLVAPHASSLNSPIAPAGSLAAQQAAAALADTKWLVPSLAVDAGELATVVKALPAATVIQPVYGFSMTKRATGEAYLVEVVDADLDVPDQLPDPTTNKTYDPYYVRVVDLARRVAYSMSVIVPSIAYDQHREYALTETEYLNVLSESLELPVGYLPSDRTQDEGLEHFALAPIDAVATRRAALGNPAAEAYVHTYLPYAALGADGRFATSGSTPRIREGLPNVYFLCRRLNWDVDCLLMRSTHASGSIAFKAFGGGDLAPVLLDKDPVVDRSVPGHFTMFTDSYTTRSFDAVRAATVETKPLAVAVTTQSGYAEYQSFFLDPASLGSNPLDPLEGVLPTAGTTLTFPDEIFVLGEATTTLTSVVGGTGSLVSTSNGAITSEFALVPYGGLVYLVRAMQDVPQLAGVGGLGITSGLLIDTYVPSSGGGLTLAPSARYKRSGLKFFGNSYTPTTFVDSLDNLDFTDIAGNPFYAPTLFIPIPELDTSSGFVADLSDFLGATFWTFVYPELVLPRGARAGGATFADGLNLDPDGKPILSLQKLQLVYDSIAVAFTPNDLSHKYPLQAKQQVLALTNGQVAEGIAWRTSHVQPDRTRPHNLTTQDIATDLGHNPDATNIVYSARNRPVATPTNSQFRGVSVHGIRAVSGCVYNIEESAFSQDQAAQGLISQVSSNATMMLGILIDYDTNEYPVPRDVVPRQMMSGLVLINGYLGPTGYVFSSPDHVDVDDVLPSQTPLLEKIVETFGPTWNLALYNPDISLPEQFWSFTYDGFTAAGVPNFITDVPPAPADPSFTNRTRSLLLNFESRVNPDGLGLMDTYGSVVSANIHLRNGVTGSVLVSKKADRNVASISGAPTGGTSHPLVGLEAPVKYDFFLFSRDHYDTLQDAQFHLIDQGYAMCLVDDGTGTGSKVARYFVDTDGNYNELYTYVLFSSARGILETSSFTVKVALGAPANPNTAPATPETPNNVNPQDIVKAINTASTLLFAASGPSTSGQSPAFLPIQVAGTESTVQAGTISGPPGFNGYAINVMAVNRQPVQIANLYSGGTAYPIAGTTTTVPLSSKGKAVPFYGSLAYGLDKQVGTFGGAGGGSLIGTPLSFEFQGSVAAGGVMKGDDAVFYTVNAPLIGVAGASAVTDSTSKAAAVGGHQYFIDETDPAHPIWGIITLPSFSFGPISASVVLSTTEPGGIAPRYTLVLGGQSYLFDAGNKTVTADNSRYTFNPVAGGAFTVTHGAAESPLGILAPSPLSLSPFTIVAGGVSKQVDVFNDAGGLDGIVLGPLGRVYSYGPVAGVVTITGGSTTTTARLQSGLGFASSSNYAYVLGVDEGSYTVNSLPTVLYNASTSGVPASYPIMTSPQVFTLGGDFYVFDQDATGAYLSVTGAGQIHPVNPYQFSINGTIYVIDQTVQPNVVVGGGRTHPMTAGNSQFELDGAQYTIALKGGSMLGATVSGQFNIEQGNVVVIENFVYQLDTLNAQVVGNGSAYPLTTSGTTYTISTSDDSFTVTSAPNATTVTIGNVEYLIGSNTVVGDGIVYPILPYRSFSDGGEDFEIGLDGHVTTLTTFPLSGTAPYTNSTFTDGTTYTVNVPAAFDGTSYHLLSGAPSQFTAAGHTYTLRNDGVSVTAGPAKTYLGPRTGALSPTAFALGSATIHLGRASDLAAFDGVHYFAIADNSFTDTVTGLTYTLDGNTAVNEGSSYEIFSNLGQSPYFEVPGGPTYFINVAVADTGSANGDVYSVFPVSSGGFTIPTIYTVAIAGGVAKVSSPYLAATAMPTLEVVGSSLTGGYFTDPVTGIGYTVVVDGMSISMVDSNNAIYPYAVSGAGGTFTASVVVATAVQLAVDETESAFPIANGQFTAGGTSYLTGAMVAYENAAGPYWPITQGRFVVPRPDPLSDVAYSLAGGHATRGYAVSYDDQFSVDGKVVYAVNAVNVVRTASTPTLAAGGGGTQTLTDGARSYTLDAAAHTASIAPSGVSYASATHSFHVTYRDIPVTYTLSGTTVTDSRSPVHTFAAVIGGGTATFQDSLTRTTFSFPTGGGAVTASFPYTNDFFLDTLASTTYYVDEPDAKVNALSYLPEQTAYGFVAGDGVTYLIHYNDVSVVFPVIAGEHVNAGIATVGADEFTVHVDEVAPLGGGTPIPVSPNSFEINGEQYAIAGTPVGDNYSSCHVVGAAGAPRPFTGPTTFVLSDPTITYTLHLDSGVPAAVTADFPVRPSQDLINVADDVYVVTYATATSGSLLGQGSSTIPISDSKFTLTNRFDSTKGQFIFADADIFDAASVVGQFTVYAAPTFVIDAERYTLDTAALVVTDASRHPYPLVRDPAFFSVNGANYLIDTNRVPHAVVGNDNVSPLATDVTIEHGQQRPNSTFTLGGLVYRYVEDNLGTLLAISGTKTFPIAQPAGTFKLDSSLLFTLVSTPPAAGGYPGPVVPIGTATAGTTVLDVYPGIPESGGSDFFTYKNQLYTLIKSGAVYEAVEKTYTVYAASPTDHQQQLALFDLAGTSYLLTDGTPPGAAAPAGTNPGTLWASTASTAVETQFGLVYGLAATPTTITQSATPSGATVFQFLNTVSGATTLYDVDYVAGALGNHVQVDVPNLLPSFDQTRPFDFVGAAPLTVETGGYNAFTTFVGEYGVPAADYNASFATDFHTTGPHLSELLTPQGDFSIEMWHSVPARPQGSVHPVTLDVGPVASYPVTHVDIDYENPSDLWVRINDTALHALTPPVPVFGAGWRHLALSYTQPYTMQCTGEGFQVKDGNSYDLAQDFTISFTFQASDVATEQGLIYKGAQPYSPTPSSVDVPFSYRVTLLGGSIVLDLTDATGTVQTFSGAPGQLFADTWYEVIISKQTSTPLSSGTTGPYSLPFDTSHLADPSANGASVQTSGSIPGELGISTITPQGTDLSGFMTNISTSGKAFTVSIAVRVANPGGTFGPWEVLTPTQSGSSEPIQNTVSTDQQLQLMRTGSAPLLFGVAAGSSAVPVPLGSDGGSVGFLRDVYLFSTAVFTNVDQLNSTFDDAHPAFSTAGATQLMTWGIVGYWVAAYNPDGVVANTIDADRVAVSRKLSNANLVPVQPGHELEGASLYLDGYPISLAQVPLALAPASIGGAAGSTPLLRFDASDYHLQEISLWQMARQQYQALDDMFGRLVPSNEPYLALYLSSDFQVASVAAPALPVFAYIDNVLVHNGGNGPNLMFTPASYDLTGSPALSRTGPLVSPNLYTPPGQALQVADSSPALSTFSVTLNSVTGALAGVVKEAYVYVSAGVLMIYMGKKVGDLVLSWVTQEQADPQLIGYIEGAPPAPMANLTNKPSYAGATSVTLKVPTSVTYKYAAANTSSSNTALKLTGNLVGSAIPAAPLIDAQIAGEYHLVIAPMGGGSQTPAAKFLKDAPHDDNNYTRTAENQTDTSVTPSNKLDEISTYTLKMQGSVAPYDGDQFMAALNSQTVPSATPGVTAQKAAILPDPTVGGFTASNPPAALPKTQVNDEHYGQRMFQPSPYGHAFVTSTTVDVYQQTLLQSNTIFGFVAVPNAEIPRDLNVIPFRMSSRYLRPGVLDGVVGYGFKPASLADGEHSYGTSTGQMELISDGNFEAGEIGHDASYMRIVEAYTLKRQIDQQALGAIGQYAARYNGEKTGDNTGASFLETFFIHGGGDTPDAGDTPLTLVPSLDFYDEYLWSARGGTEEVHHTWTTTYEESHTTTTTTTNSFSSAFNIKLQIFAGVALDLGLGMTFGGKSVDKYTLTTTGTRSFDVAASFDGIEPDTQMRYTSNNDAHFVMRNNSMFNRSNDSGLELVIGSDGLVYNIEPSPTSGAGLPLSDNVDTTRDYSQPLPSYAAGNADGTTGTLVPYDRPGKTSKFRAYSFFLQPSQDNASEFWDTVIDRTWLMNSTESDALALREALADTQGNPTGMPAPWRLLYRVTYSERFLPPTTLDVGQTPQITPLMAVPVLDAAGDFLFHDPKSPAPARNPHNDVDANPVLVAPTASGALAGTVQTKGSFIGQALPPNNLLGFDLLKNVTQPVSWGDAANTKLISTLVTSALGLGSVPMTHSVLAGAALQTTVTGPDGEVLYSVYTDPNGLTVNVPVKPGITVHQDVNGNPIQYFDGKIYRSLQDGYVASPDGSVMYYLQPPASYDQTRFDVVGDYDLFGQPGDEWRFYLVSGFSSDLTSEASFGNSRPFESSLGAGPDSVYTGFTVASAQHAGRPPIKQVQGYVIVQGVLQWPNVAVNAETVADVTSYKALSVLDTFPLGDPSVLVRFVESLYPNAPFAGNQEITDVLARNVISYFNKVQQGLIPQ